jgi:hypothetical protein
VSISRGHGIGLREAAIAALVLTVVLGAVSDTLFLAAYQFRLDWFADPTQVVHAGSGSAEILEWAALTDLFSYYLPTAVVAIALWAAMRSRGPALAAGATAAAFGYVIAGSIGAASLAMAGPALMRDYVVPGADQATIGLLFSNLVVVVFRAIWQLLDGVLIAVWMIGIGWLIRSHQPGFGRLTIALGALFGIGAALTALGLGVVRDATLLVIFPVWTVWSIWLAVALWRRRPPFDDALGWESSGHVSEPA